MGSGKPVISVFDTSYSPHAVAEHTIALILALNRMIGFWRWVVSLMWQLARIFHHEGKKVAKSFF